MQFSIYKQASRLTNWRLGLQLSQMDLMYISNPSIVQDLRIIFATIKILFMKESTEGVAEGQTTAGDVKLDKVENAGQGAEDKAV